MEPSILFVSRVPFSFSFSFSFSFFLFLFLCRGKAKTKARARKIYRYEAVTPSHTELGLPNKLFQDFSPSCIVNPNLR